MWDHHPKLALCARAMHRGGVIAYPTEAVWGLGCDPFNRHAVDKLLSLKQRPWQKGVILVAANIEQVEFLLADLSQAQRQQLEDTWPGHTTWLVPHAGKVPAFVHGDHASIALRVSAHPLVAALCRRFGGPIVSTSANPQGLPPARTATAVRRYFKDDDIDLAPGVTGKQPKPSTIRDLISGKVLR